MDKDLCFIFLFYKHTYTCGNNDDDSSRQLLIKSEAYKYLIVRNVRHIHSLLAPDEQSMLRFSLIILNKCEQQVSFPVYKREKIYRKREEREKGRRREIKKKALRKQSQIRRTCFEVTTTSKKRKDYH